MINMIACISRNRGLGYNGELLFKIPEDLKLFNLMTCGGIVVMGRKTWEGLSVQPLPHRANIVLSESIYKQMARNKTIDTNPESLRGNTELIWAGSTQHNPALGDPRTTSVAWVANFEALDKYIDEHIEDDIWIIGGQALYERYVERADKIILTEVDAEPLADTFFPMLDPYCCAGGATSTPVLGDCDDYAIIDLKSGEWNGLKWVTRIYQRLEPWKRQKEYNAIPENRC